MYPRGQIAKIHLHFNTLFNTGAPPPILNLHRYFYISTYNFKLCERNTENICIHESDKFIVYQIISELGTASKPFYKRLLTLAKIKTFYCVNDQFLPWQIYQISLKMVLFCCIFHI